jgi:Uma2 family endonuclease
MKNAMTWEQICDDPTLRDLPYKIEQDRFGRIVMSTARTNHGWYQIEIAKRLCALLPDWAVLAECGVNTAQGVKVPDLAAMPIEFARGHIGSASLPESPPLCVEVLSESNTLEEMREKRGLLAARGCREFWSCSEDGRMTFIDAALGAPLPTSVLCPDFPKLISLA